MKLSSFPILCLFHFIGKYKQFPSDLSSCSCFGDSAASEARELITSPPDLPWQTDDNQQFVDRYPYKYELGTKTVPENYLLTITPNLQRGTFDGRVLIVIKAIKKTKTIKLNSEKLDVKEVTVKTCTEPERNLGTTFKLKVKKNFLIIETLESLVVDKSYRVVIEFSGHLYQRNPFGFAMYRTSLTTTSKDAYAAETLFDPFFARRAFPCYDELHYRTPFSLEIVLNENENAVCNARLERTEPLHEENNREKKKITFKRSSLTSVNAIYYAVLDEEYVCESTQGKYFVWMVNEFIGQVSYAAQDLRNAVENIESLIIFSGYFERIDLVVPIQKQLQAGLLSYVKKNLLCDPAYCSEKHQEQVTRSIVYHVSNKVFGQYVSIRSWNYFWLRDGFRTYYGFRITDLMKPNWGVSEFHGSVVMQSIMNDDRRFFVHPLTRHHNPSKREVFETQHSKSHFEFYNGKASSIIRMLEHIVGRRIFDSAVKEFLRLTDRGLVWPDGLWHAFMEQIRRDSINLKLPGSQTLQDVMKPFTTQVGYPLLIVSETTDRKIIIEQVPYVSTRESSLSAKLDSKKVDDKRSWIVPITITTQTKENRNTRPVAWSMPDTKIILDTKRNEREWYILNVKNTGYYRVNYPHDNWENLVEQLKKDRSKIHPLNRAQLIVDSHVLAVDMKLAMTIPIEMITYLRDEHDPSVWMVALNQFKRFYLALPDNSRPAYKQFFVGCLKNEYRKVGFNINRNDTHAGKIWKSELLKFLCWIGDHQCVRDAEKLYDDYGDNLANIDPNLQHVVFCTMLQRQDQVPVMASLEEMIKRNNNSCLRDVVRDVSICAHAPVGDENLIRMKVESLLNRSITGDPTAENIMNDILSHFDTLLPFLKVIQDQIRQMIVTGRNTHQNLDGLAKFVGILKGKEFGLPEFIAFHDLYKSVRKLAKESKRYTSLKIALLKIVANFKGGIEDLRTEESSLANILRTAKCDSEGPETSSSSSSGSISILPPPFSDSSRTIDVSGAIRDILIESETLMTEPQNSEIRPYSTDEENFE